MTGVLQMLLAKTKPLIASISDQTSTQTNPGGTATAGYKLLSSGVAQKKNGASYGNISGEWLVSGTNADFKAKATLATGGPLTTNTMSAFQTLSSDQSFTLTATGNDVSATVTVEIQRTSDSVSVDTATITLNALGAP